jgi:hypothetical protein
MLFASILNTTWFFKGLLVLGIHFETVNRISFGLRKILLKWNDYSYKIVVLLFDRDLFLRILIPLQRKNYRKNYFLSNRQRFRKKKKSLFYFIFYFNPSTLLKKEKKILKCWIVMGTHHSRTRGWPHHSRSTLWWTSKVLRGWYDQATPNAH